MTFYADDERTFRITRVGEMRLTRGNGKNLFIECDTADGTVAFWGSLYAMENLNAIKDRPTPFDVTCGCRKPELNFPQHRYWVPETANINIHAEGPPVNTDTLYVVTCTKLKIWASDGRAPIFVPAQDAYLGKTASEWMASRLRTEAKYWLFLSAKYGFIEPEHPIGNYDVTFSDLATGPISDASLKAQVMHQRRWNDSVPLRNFKQIHVWATDIYEKKVRMAFEAIAKVNRLRSL